MTLERFARFDALCAGMSCERPGPLLAVHQLSPGLYPELRAAVLAFLESSAPRGTPAGDERALLDAYVGRGHTLPWVTGSGRVLPTQATARVYARLVRAVGAILESTAVTSQLASIHLFSVKVKGGRPAEGGQPEPLEVETPHLETWQGSTVSTVAFHLPVLGDLERNLLQFYSTPDDFDEAWLRSVPSPEEAWVLARRFHPSPRAPRPGELVIFDTGTLHHTTRLPGSGPRVTMEIMATLPGPDTRIDHRPWDEALPVERFLAIGRQRLLLPAEPTGKTVRVGSWERLQTP